MSLETPPLVRRVPRWPFIIADVFLVGLVVAILMLGEQPTPPVLAVPAVFAVLLAAVLGVAPWAIEGWADRTRERGELQAAVETNFELQGKVLEALRAHAADLGRLAGDRDGGQLAEDLVAARDAVERLRDDLASLEERLVGRVEDTASGTMEFLGTKVDNLVKPLSALRSGIARLRDDVVAAEERLVESLADLPIRGLAIEPMAAVAESGSKTVAERETEPAGAAGAVAGKGGVEEQPEVETEPAGVVEEAPAEVEHKPRRRRAAAAKPAMEPGLFDADPLAPGGADKAVDGLLPGSGEVRRGPGVAGQVQLVARVNVGMGDFTYVRGSGPGLREDRGAPLKFVEIGRWEWHAEADGPVTVQLLRNDREPAQGEPITIAPGERVEVSPVF